MATPATSPNRGRLPAFFYRLSARAQRCYLSSDVIEHFDFSPSPRALELTAHLMVTLATESPAAIQRAACELVRELCRCFGIGEVELEVRGVRPHNARGELHGIFYPARQPRIVLWMRTARRRQVVKPKTFLRTLLHEVAHYLDYSVLKLDDSFHTAGFFKRESALVRALHPTNIDSA